MIRTTSVVAATVALAGASSAFTLTDGNASAEFGMTGFGQSGFSVAGQDQLEFQGFYLQIAAGPTIDMSMVAYDSVGTLNADFDAGDEVFTAQQTVGGLQFNYRFTLVGGLPASNNASLEIRLDVTNVSDTAISFQLIEFANFDLGGTTLDSGIEFLNGNTVIQQDGAALTQEVAETPAPDSFEVGTLIDVNSSAFAGTLDGTTQAGAGDLAWAFGWERTLGDGELFQLSKVISIEIPTPGSAALLGAAGLAACRRRR